MKRLLATLLTAAILAVSASSAAARASLEIPRHCPTGLSAASVLLGNQPQAKNGSANHPPLGFDYPPVPVARLYRYEGRGKDLP